MYPLKKYLHIYVCDALWFNLLCLLAIASAAHLCLPACQNPVCMEDYGWPITSFLALINDVNRLPLLLTKQYLS